MYAWQSIVGGRKVLFDNEIVGGGVRGRGDLNSRCLCWNTKKCELSYKAIKVLEEECGGGLEAGKK